MTCTGHGKGIPSKHLVTLLVLRGTVLIYFWLRSLRILTVVLLFSQDFDFRVTVLSWFWLVLLFSHDFDCRVTVLSGFWLSCYCSLRILTAVLLFSQGDCRVTVLSGFWLIRYGSLEILIVIVQFPSILAVMFSKEFYFYDTVLPRVLLLQLLMFGDGWKHKISLNMASFNIGFYLTFSTKHFVSRYN